MDSHSIVVSAILFDMDGVLINSVAADERSWWRWATVHGMQDTFHIQSTHGRRTVDTIRALRPDLDWVTELKRVEAFDAEDTIGLTVYPGVTDLLARLNRTQWSVVTSASGPILRGRLGLVGIQLPEHVVTADKVEQGKPHPEPYRLGAAQLGFRPEDCLVIEDAPAGIRSGKAAGCRVLAVTNSHQPHELQEADWVINSLTRVEVQSAPDGKLHCRWST